MAWLVAPATTLGMTLNQMRSLPGATVIGMRVDEVLRVYGIPAAILQGGAHWDPTDTVEWQGRKMQLGRGTWNLVYRADSVSQRKSPPGWRNPKPAMPPILSGVSNLELMALGEVGVVTIDRTAHKTTYMIPADPFLSHKIIKAQARFTSPRPTRKIENLYEDKCESVTNDDGQHTLRCWVLVEKDVMPVALYAVDFLLTKNNDKVSGYTISGDGVDYVRRKFSEYYQHWLDMIND